MSLKARALYFSAAKSVEIREEMIEAVGDQILVRSRLIGISHGTEMLAFRGHLPRQLEADTSLKSLAGTLEYPLKYGYINTGETKTGRKVFAFYPHQDLFFADPREIVELPPDLDHNDAVFLANMETALGIVHDANPRFGEIVLLIGQGVVGLLTAEILIRAGLGKVITVEPHAIRRQASEQVGCVALQPGAGLQQKILEQTEGRGVDVAINVSASADGLQLAIDSLAFEGTVVEASWYGRRPVTLDLGSAFHRKRLRLRSSQVSRIDPALTGRWDKQRRLAQVVELLETIRPSRYISHRFALDRAQEAYELLDNHPDRTVQVVLEP
ncbi:MAG: zinc-binding alcohol dehydrogenase [Spirochaetaceae bacterium]|nr:MAG: zinc-binding alcohol dehydrogenase [Spirochaetaceae bacterium]